MSKIRCEINTAINNINIPSYLYYYTYFTVKITFVYKDMFNSIKFKRFVEFDNVVKYNNVIEFLDYQNWKRKEKGKGSLQQQSRNRK